jgi:hypothetical protein
MLVRVSMVARRLMEDTVPRGQTATMALPTMIFQCFAPGS